MLLFIDWAGDVCVGECCYIEQTDRSINDTTRQRMIYRVHRFNRHDN